MILTLSYREKNSNIFVFGLVRNITEIVLPLIELIRMEETWWISIAESWVMFVWNKNIKRRQSSEWVTDVRRRPKVDDEWRMKNEGWNWLFNNQRITNNQRMNLRIFEIFQINLWHFIQITTSLSLYLNNFNHAPSVVFLYDPFVFNYVQYNYLSVCLFVMEWKFFHT